MLYGWFVLVGDGRHVSGAMMHVLCASVVDSTVTAVTVCCGLAYCAPGRRLQAGSTSVYSCVTGLLHGDGSHRVLRAGLPCAWQASAGRINL